MGKLEPLVPLIFELEPVNVIVRDAADSVPPLFVQFPPTVTSPARVRVTPELICKLLNVIGAVGVTVELPVKTVLLPEVNVKAIGLTVRLPPILRLLPETV